MRAISAEITILFVAFVAAAARLLWGLARPWIALGSLLLIGCSPELLRQLHTGGADVPVAIYLSLFLLAAVVWMVTGERLGLLLVFVFASVAALTKSEGAPQLIVFLVVMSVFAVRRAPRRAIALWGAAAAGLLTLVPWVVWRVAHDVDSVSGVPLDRVFDTSYLLDRTDRIEPAARVLADHIFNPQEWVFVVSLLLLLSLAGLAVTRRLVWLAPAALCGAGYAFWVWVNWADSLDLTYRLDTSAWRVVDGLVLTAGVLLPLTAEALIRRRGVQAAR
jgi:hypothetical protein